MQARASTALEGEEGAKPPGWEAGKGHDDLDQVTSYDPPMSSNSTTYTYTADRKVDAETRPNGASPIVLDYQYNAMTGKLTSIQRVLSNTQKINLAYDGVGRLWTTKGPAWSHPTTPKQTLTTLYAGRFPTSEELSGAVAAGTVSWTYDAAHRIASESINAANTVATTYDDDDLLIGAGELTIGRDADSGKITTITNTHSSVTFEELRFYDGFGQLSKLEYKRAGAALFTIEYTRDDLGRILTQLETIVSALLGTPGSVSIGYEYDDVGRLLRVTRGGIETEEYTYDTNGNRATVSYNGGSAMTSTIDDQDRMTALGPWSVLYTITGEVTRRSKTAPNAGYQNLAYDPFGNTTSIQVYSGGTTTTYEADGRGRRTSRKVGAGNPTRWLWSTGLRPAAQLSHTNTVSQRYVYSDGANVPDLVINGSDRWRLVKDHLGSVRYVINVATGAVVRKLVFDAFGRVTASSGTATAVPFGFAGGLWEPATGLVRFGARDYDPETGRWTSKDPIRFEGGDANIYAYVGNDPVNLKDPSGLDAEFCDNLLGGELDRCAEGCMAEANSKSTFDSVCEALGFSEESESPGDCIRKCGEAVREEFRKCYEPYQWPNDQDDEPDWDGGDCHSWECLASR